MSISLVTVVVRRSRRLRLIFDNAVAASAFASTSPYSVDNTDGLGASPHVQAALMVPGVPTGVELALDCDLVPGASYTATATGVAALDGSGVSLGTPVAFQVAGEAPSVGITVSPAEATAYLVDLAWSGTDFLLTSAGDLATIGGVPNVQGALLRRLTDEDGLPWLPSYGTRSRGYVDGPAPDATTLRGAIIRQATSDPRVSACGATFDTSANDGSVQFNVKIQLRGSSSKDSLSLSVPIRA